MTESSAEEGTSTLDWRLVTLMLVGAVCLGLRSAFESGQIPSPWETFHFNPGVIVGYGVVPLLTLVVLRINPLPYFRIGSVLPNTKLLAAVVAFVLAMAFVESRLGDFKEFYGAWPRAHPAVMAAGFLVNNTSDEFFFRGFLLFPLRKKFGWYVIPIATMPYCVAHAGKPLMELFDSIPFGIAMSYLALRTESILYGIAIHMFFGAVLIAWTR